MEQSNQTSVNISQIACHDCDLLQKVPQLRVGQTANCLRCNAFLFKNQKNSVDRSLAFAITGLILYIISNMFPLLSLRALGTTQDETLISTSISLFKADMPLLSIVVLFTTVIFPATTLLGTIFILIQVKRDTFNDYTAPLFRFLRSTDTWGMLEIFMLALLVAMVKLGDVAEVIFGTSLYAFCLLILSLTMLSHSLNPHDVWSKLRRDITQ
ncbi:paraquat-inducible protein A [Cocleimonas flava]|jgi:paraquat-inducible protein A|uniref:Paraquat-inducible protein A n=1 Tax=Cocleimonas flava TaxID=634765 RepID=A0A4R1F9N2_9GAMM|nr:paraquat-inducible protein A [Cocleimonas flava]TCJ88578.1 paraquat-inducible protein A [Cocleimonas flava]